MSIINCYFLFLGKKEEDKQENGPDDPLKKYFYSVGYQEMSKAVF